MDLYPSSIFQEVFGALQTQYNLEMTFKQNWRVGTLSIEELPVNRLMVKIPYVAFHF